MDEDAVPDYFFLQKLRLGLCFVEVVFKLAPFYIECAWRMEGHLNNSG